MQEITNEIRRRARNLDVAARFRAINVIRPFLGSFEGWNKRAARLGALIDSHAATEHEKAIHREELGALRAEIQLSNDQFREAVADQPRHSRIDDVEAAFDRLLFVLNAVAS